MSGNDEKVVTTVEVSAPSFWNGIQLPHCYVDFQANPLEAEIFLPNLTLENELTVEAWVRPKQESLLGYIVFCKATFAVALQRGEVVVAFRSTPNWKLNWKWIHSYCRCPLNEWSHVTVTYVAGVENAGTGEQTPGTCKIYINGILRQTSEVGGPLNASGEIIRVGVQSFRKLNAKHTRLVGHVARVRVWDRALPPNEVAQTWKIDISTPKPNLLGNWPLDEPCGTFVFDKSGNGRAGEVKVDANQNPMVKRSIGVTIPRSSLAADLIDVLQSEKEITK